MQLRDHGGQAACIFCPDSSILHPPVPGRLRHVPSRWQEEGRELGEQGLGWLALPLLLRKRGVWIWGPQLTFSSPGRQSEPPDCTPTRAPPAFPPRAPGCSHPTRPPLLPSTPSHLSSQGCKCLLTPPRLRGDPESLMQGKAGRMQPLPLLCVTRRRPRGLWLGPSGQGAWAQRVRHAMGVPFQLD